MSKLIEVIILSLTLATCAQMAGQSTSGLAPEAKDIPLVGFNDLQSRSAYQPVIHRQADRFIAYIRHHGGSALNPLTGRTVANGTSIIDVPDPRAPKHLAQFPASAPGPSEARAGE